MNSSADAQQEEAGSFQRAFTDLVVREKQESKPARVLKPVSVVPYKPKPIDGGVVGFDFYDAFNYSLIATGSKDFRLSVGVTSANPGEGKTLTASNLAVSLSLGHEKKTVLVELNTRKPMLDRVFGTSPAPGLSEAMKTGDIIVSPTRISLLSVLPVGGSNGVGRGGEHGSGARGPSLSLNHLSDFRDVLYSLEQEFECVIVDMPSINGRDFPILYANQLDGLIVVVDTSRTTKKDLDRMFRVVNERQILGFVLNRFSDER